MITTSPINDYLRKAKRSVKDRPPAGVVIGNEAADLDSVVSALVQAWLSTLVRARETIPVITIPRHGLKLRPEIGYVLNKAGVNPENIIFGDEVELDRLLAGETELVLVDRNRLPPSLEKFGGRVREIIDHHEDEGLYPWAAKRIIEPVGSTSTLVAREVLKQAAGLPGRDIVLLLAGAILLDTVNLAPRARRGTAEDKRILDLLLKKHPLDRDEYFSAIQAEKFNCPALSPLELLGRDYKEWRTGRIAWGIASVPLSVDKWRAGENNLPLAFARFAAARDLTVLISMNYRNTPVFRRGLVVFCRNHGLHERLIAFLRQKGLLLGKITGAAPDNFSEGEISFYQQENTDISRKKLQPLVKDFFLKFFS